MSSCRSLPVFPSRRSLWLALAALGLALIAGAVARADYTGPVPPPTDQFGATGPYSVLRETLPSPDWPGQVVTVFRPANAAGRRPVWFFAHGFGGTEPEYYLELLTHLASHGDVVIFSPYPIARPGATDVLYEIMWDGFVAAANQYAGVIDSTRVGFAGHSYGGGAVPWLALKGVRERGWGSQGLALFLLAPWFSSFVSDNDLASFPAQTQAIVHVYEDDLINDHRMAIDLFTHLNVPAANKDYLMVHSDRIDGYNYTASHRVPTGWGNADSGFTSSAFDALDRWAVLRIARALSASALHGDATGRAIALGHGSAAQTQMGATLAGRALRPMTETGAPVPLFPETRYKYGFHHRLNPRIEATLPTPVTKPRLLNLSARAWSGPGEEVLIVGTSIAGPRPKSLLVRAVGPGLRPHGVPDAMTDPRLELHRSDAIDLAIDDWADAPSPDAIGFASAETGAFALADGSKDAALLASFSAGLLTAHAGGSSSGVTLLELYDADLDATARLENLSARARIGSGDATLIAGFVVGGGEVRLLVRGIGPSLVRYGVAGALPDPELELYRDGELIAANDNWSSDPSAAAAIRDAASQVGAFSLVEGSSDASLLVTLPPGVYSMHVRPHDARNGVGLAEIYLLP